MSFRTLAKGRRSCEGAQVARIGETAYCRWIVCRRAVSNQDRVWLTMVSALRDGWKPMSCSRSSTGVVAGWSAGDGAGVRRYLIVTR